MANVQTINSLLCKIYFNVKNPACYGSALSVYREARKSLPEIKLKEVKKWLRSQRTWSLHKPIIKKFPRRRIIVSGATEQYQCDLCDMSALAAENQGYKYLLTCIDVFSKRAWAIALKNKSSKATTRALKVILKQGVPRVVQTDGGKEFRGQFEQFLRDKGIEFVIAYNPDIKCAVVERFNRTLKARIWKYFTENNTFKYIDILQDVVNAYNHSFHRSIKCRPVDVGKANEREIRTNLYGDDEFPTKSFLFEVGDKVRLAVGKGEFDKGYYENWTREVFIVDSRKMRDQPVYYVKDLTGRDIYGVFYDKELQKVY